jgi:hypothetical protein
LKQYQVTANGVSFQGQLASSLLADKSDNVYLLTSDSNGGPGLLKVETAQGAELARHSGLSAFEMNSAKDTAFSWTGGLLQTPDLAAFSLHPIAKVEPQRSAILDPVENVIWTGRMGGGGPLVAATGALYLSGTYTNRYQNGSVTRAGTNPSYVGRYGLDGTRVWFQELTFETDAGLVTNQIRRTFLDVSGNLLIEADTAGSPAATAGAYLFKLSAADGTVM